MRMLLDGVFFQLASSGIARVWQPVMPGLIAEPDFELFVLDRGNLPDLPGLRRIPFPTYRDLYTADDSALIQRICDQFAIDVFSSSYYTTPLTTPMFLIVYDMIPELYGFDLSLRHWQEKALAISYARRHIAISHQTNKDLVRLNPDLDQTSVAHLGYDRANFRPRDTAEVEAFLESIGFGERPYLLTVGSREQHHGYKNGRLLFDAIATHGPDHTDILCIGGEEKLDEALLAALPGDVRVKRILATDVELALAYSGAQALVYPSLYEGFGLPVLEAMACGCPVITTTRGSLAEVAGDACLAIDGSSIEELIDALGRLEHPGIREGLRAAGLKRAAMFDWAAMTAAVIEAARQLAGLAADPDYRAFADRWSALRQMQAEVDIDRWR